MIHNLSDIPSIFNQFISEIRDASIQQDRLRFRNNLERIGYIMAYEISKNLSFKNTEVETPLGIAEVVVPDSSPVLATILRAGLPMHQGFLSTFDQAENAFVSAYRMHHKDGTFEIKVEYTSCPDIEGKVLIIIDPMLATGASMSATIKRLLQFGQPKAIHLATAIASSTGIEHVKRHFPGAIIWAGAIDDELTAKSYIVPGLGDAGDLAYGEKNRDEV